MGSNIPDFGVGGSKKKGTGVARYESSNLRSRFLPLSSFLMQIRVDISRCGTVRKGFFAFNGLSFGDKYSPWQDREAALPRLSRRSGTGGSRELHWLLFFLSLPSLFREDPFCPTWRGQSTPGKDSLFLAHRDVP